MRPQTRERQDSLPAMTYLLLMACTEMPIGSDRDPNDADQVATIGEEAVDLPLVDQNGDTFFLADERGKVIFLDMSGFH